MAVVVTGGAPGQAIAAGIFLVGTVGVTAVVNVPMNEALAAVDGEDADGVVAWIRYRTRWTMWNHVRVVAAGTASAVLAVS